jgi:hypothetical protein
MNTVEHSGPYERKPVNRKRWFTGFTLLLSSTYPRNGLPSDHWYNRLAP